MTEYKKNLFPTPRALRNTAKQSILISGQPDFLYRYKEIKETFIVFDGKKKSIGSIADDIHLAFCDLAKGTEVRIIRETKSRKSPVTKIEGFPSISIQKHKKDTMLVIPAANEAALIEKVSKLKELLESKGAITQERCNWICVVDKGKTKVPEPEDRKITTESDLKEYSIENKMSEKTKSLHSIMKSILEEQEKRP